MFQGGVLYQTVHLDACMELSEVPGPVEEHGFGLIESRSVPRHERVWQSIVLSVSLHLALISTFVLIPKSSSNMGTPWIEVRLVAFTEESTPAGYGEGGASGEDLPMAGPPAESPPARELPQPPPKTELSEKPREKEPTKPVAKQAVMRSRSTASLKETAAKSVVQNDVSPVEPLPASGPQSEDTAPGPPSGNTASAQGLAESGGGGSGSGGGSHGRGGDGGGTVDAEFGTANGPRFARKSLPKYPHLARQLGKEAVVVLRVTIDEQGRPITVEAVQSAGPGFDEEAIRAVKESLFHPAKREGKAVMCRAVLPIRFQLKGSD